VKRPAAPTMLSAFAASLIVACAGCAYRPRNMLKVSAPGNAEGKTAQVTVTVTNVHPEVILPVTMTLVARKSPAMLFSTPSRLAENNYLKPVRAAEVRYLSSLDRIELIQIRTAGVWRRLPDTRYQHPARILLPGQSFTETFDCRLTRGYERHLYCDFRYLRMSGESVIGRLYARQNASEPDADAELHIEAYVRVKETNLSNVDSTPNSYILHRRRPSATETRMVSKRVRTDGTASPPPATGKDEAAPKVLLPQTDPEPKPTDVPPVDDAAKAEAGLADPAGAGEAKTPAAKLGTEPESDGAAKKGAEE